MVLSLSRPILCLVCLARLRTAREFFSEPISKKETALSFFFLLDYASRTCSMPRQYFFCTYRLPNRVKYYLNSQNFPPF